MSEVLGAKCGRVVQKQKLRHDGWTKKRRAIFLDHLAATGNVRFAVAAAGKSDAGVYQLRRRDPAFAAAWDEALVGAYARIEAELVARAIGGEPVDYTPGDGGEVTPAPFNEKLAMSMMTRQDARAAGHKRIAHNSRHATLAEVEVALRRKLDALARRMAKQP